MAYAIREVAATAADGRFCTRLLLRSLRSTQSTSTHALLTWITICWHLVVIVIIWYITGRRWRRWQDGRALNVVLQVRLKPAVGLRILASLQWWLAVAVVWRAIHVAHSVADSFTTHATILCIAFETRYVDFVLIFATWARTLWIVGRRIDYTFVVAALLIMRHLVHLIQLILICKEILVPPLLGAFDGRVVICSVHRFLGAWSWDLWCKIEDHLVIFDLDSTVLDLASIGQFVKICSLGDKHSINYLANLFFKFNFQFSKLLTNCSL